MRKARSDRDVEYDLQRAVVGADPSPVTAKLVTLGNRRVRAVHLAVNMQTALNSVESNPLDPLSLPQFRDMFTSKSIQGSSYQPIKVQDCTALKSS